MALLELKTGKHLYKKDGKAVRMSPGDTCDSKYVPEAFRNKFDAAEVKSKDAPPADLKSFYLSKVVVDGNKLYNVMNRKEKAPVNQKPLVRKEAKELLADVLSST